VNRRKSAWHIGIGTITMHLDLDLDPTRGHDMGHRSFISAKTARVRSATFFQAFSFSIMHPAIQCSSADLFCGCLVETGFSCRPPCKGYATATLHPSRTTSHPRPRRVRPFKLWALIITGFRQLPLHFSIAVRSAQVSAASMEGNDAEPECWVSPTFSVHM
jgi:hypothetical protein